MGLDTSLFKIIKKPEIEQVFDKLVDAERDLKQVRYWRKNYDLLDWFGEIIGEIKNCEEYEITREIFVMWLHALKDAQLENGSREADIEMIEEILDKTDWEKTKFILYNWW